MYSEYQTPPSRPSDMEYTVDSEILANILFSQIALKDILVM